MTITLIIIAYVLIGVMIADWHCKLVVKHAHYLTPQTVEFMLQLLLSWPLFLLTIIFGKYITLLFYIIANRYNKICNGKIPNIQVHKIIIDNPEDLERQLSKFADSIKEQFMNIKKENIDEKER